MAKWVNVVSMGSELEAGNCLAVVASGAKLDWWDMKQALATSLPWWHLSYVMGLGALTFSLCRCRVRLQVCWVPSPWKNEHTMVPNVSGCPQCPIMSCLFLTLKVCTRPWLLRSILFDIGKSLGSRWMNRCRRLTLGPIATPTLAPTHMVKPW